MKSSTRPWRSWETAYIRITSDYGADIVIDGIGGEVLSEALGALASEGHVTTLGYSASRKTTIDVTNLIVPQASIRGLNMFAQPKAAINDAWNVIVSLLKSGAIKPIVAKTFPLVEAADCSALLSLRAALSAESSSQSDQLAIDREPQTQRSNKTVLKVHISKQAPIRYDPRGIRGLLARRSCSPFRKSTGR